MVHVQRRRDLTDASGTAVTVYQLHGDVVGAAPHPHTITPAGSLSNFVAPLSHTRENV